MKKKPRYLPAGRYHMGEPAPTMPSFKPDRSLPLPPGVRFAPGTLAALPDHELILLVLAVERVIAKAPPAEELRTMLFAALLTGLAEAERRRDRIARRRQLDEQARQREQEAQRRRVLLFPSRVELRLRAIRRRRGDDQLPTPGGAAS